MLKIISKFAVYNTNTSYHLRTNKNQAPNLVLLFVPFIFIIVFKIRSSLGGAMMIMLNHIS